MKIKLRGTRSECSDRVNYHPEVKSASLVSEDEDGCTFDVELSEGANEKEVKKKIEKTLVFQVKKEGGQVWLKPIVEKVKNKDGGIDVVVHCPTVNKLKQIKERK